MTKGKEQTILNVKKSPHRTHRYVLALIALWTVVAAASLAWNLFYVKKHALTEARSQARSIYDKDIFYRRWNAGQGGVYVPVTDKTRPNPYLSHIPNRDVTTKSGEMLTLINPAYMRLMRPMITEEPCLKCHADQGYKVGDVRGGVSVPIPMASIMAILNKERIGITAGHSILWLLGITVITLGGQKQKRDEAVILESEERIIELKKRIGELEENK